MNDKDLLFGDQIPFHLRNETGWQIFKTLRAEPEISLPCDQATNQIDGILKQVRAFRNRVYRQAWVQRIWRIIETT